jgi:hypothetical protein
MEIVVEQWNAFVINDIPVETYRSNDDVTLFPVGWMIPPLCTLG